VVECPSLLLSRPVLLSHPGAPRQPISDPSSRNPTPTRFGKALGNGARGLQRALKLHPRCFVLALMDEQYGAVASHPDMWQNKGTIDGDHPSCPACSPTEPSITNAGSI
jgi:hypothetical protein